MNHLCSSLLLLALAGAAAAQTPPAEPAAETSAPAPQPEPAAGEAPSEGQVTPPPPPPAPAEPVAPVAAPSEGVPAPPPPGISKLRLSGGQQLVGRVLSQDEESVVLELPGGGRVTLQASAVEGIEAETGFITEAGEVWPSDPNRTRYLYGPSAMMMKKGEKSFSQKELLFSTFAYGLTDNVSLQIGSVVPALFLGANGLNVIGAVKVGGQVSELVHVAGGLQALVIPGFGNGQIVGGGFLFATGTVGNVDRHFSLSVGRPFIYSSAQTTEPFPIEVIVTASGNLRVAKNLALVSENWVVPINASWGDPQGNVGVATSIAARVMGEHLSADLGGIWLFDRSGFATDGVPIPWLDFTYNF